MWQVYLGLSAVLAICVAIASIAFLARRGGRAEVEANIAKKAAENAERVAEIATNDKPSDVDKRLRDGEF